jgi:hypothetical protein
MDILQKIIAPNGALFTGNLDANQKDPVDSD